MTRDRGTSLGAARGRLVPALIALLLIAACAAPVPPAVNDPHEASNRARFDQNLALTRALTGQPAAPSDADPDAPETAAETSAETNPGRDGPRPVRRMVRNFGANLGTPATVINDLLQLRPDRAMENTLRFALNSTIGLAGLFDPATALGVTGRTTDFGETLHRWGAPEGAYLVLPVLGPSTERDFFGMLVDAALDPWGSVVTARESRAITAARWSGRIAAAAENADLLDANVIRTADPYAQARLLFLQARRHHLGIDTEDDFFDPYDFLD